LDAIERHKTSKISTPGRCIRQAKLREVCISGKLFVLMAKWPRAAELDSEVGEAERTRVLANADRQSDTVLRCSWGMELREAVVRANLTNLGRCGLGGPWILAYSVSLLYSRICNKHESFFTSNTGRIQARGQCSCLESHIELALWHVHLVNPPPPGN
jgi:hypothetical protein